MLGALEIDPSFNFWLPEGCELLSDRKDKGTLKTKIVEKNEWYIFIFVRDYPSRRFCNIKFLEVT